MGRLTIVDAPLEAPVPKPEAAPKEWGRELFAVDRAQAWLRDPQNWHESSLFVLKWDKTHVPTVCRHHGERLLREPWSLDLAHVVVREQARLKRGGRREEEQTDEA